jgi:hypothetical protein
VLLLSLLEVVALEALERFSERRFLLGHVDY